MQPKLLLAFVLVSACTGEYRAHLPDEGGADSPSPGTELVFRPGIQSDLEAAGCTTAACHGGQSDVVPMRVVMGPTTDDEWLANYNEVQARAGTAQSSLLLSKPMGAGGHVVSFSEGDPMMDRWSQWIALGAPYEAAAGEDAGPPADAAPPADASGAALTWVDDIEPILVEYDCRRCHGTSGNYSLASYQDALGAGTDDIPNVVPGDPYSLLITYCRDGHEGIRYADALAILQWIVDWDAREN